MYFTNIGEAREEGKINLLDGIGGNLKALCPNGAVRAWVLGTQTFFCVQI